MRTIVLELTKDRADDERGPVSGLQESIDVIAKTRAKSHAKSLEPGQYYSPEQAARLLSVNPESIRRWMRSGRLKGVKAGGYIWRVKGQDLLRFLGE